VTTAKLTGLDAAPAHLRTAIEEMQTRLLGYGKYRRIPRGKPFAPWTVSIEGARCALLLDAWLFGLHHLPERKQPSDIDWSGGYVEIASSMPLDTHDFEVMTRLVLLAHEHSIRVEVHAHTFRVMRIGLCPRPILVDGERFNSNIHHPDLATLRAKIDQRSKDGAA
jgi:hypothetical protein